MNIIQSGNQFKAGDFTILPFDLEHDAPNLGFLIQHPDIGKLVFITDSFYCKYKFNNLSHIMLEANYSMPILNENIDKGYLPYALRNRIVRSHMSLESAKNFLKANDLSQVKDITLIHLSDGNSNAKQFKNKIEGLTGIPTYIADAGLKFEL